MKRLLLLIVFITFSGSIFGQVNNVNDFLRFSKKSDELKKVELGLKMWNIVQPETLKTENDITTESSVYNKTIGSESFSIKLEKSQSENSDVLISKATVEIPNGTLFDEWINGIENLGYNFVKVNNQNGRLITGEKNFMILADILNIDQNSSKWKYHISTVITSPREKAKYPISQAELNKLKNEFNSEEFAKTSKVWLDEYYSQGWDDPNVKFSCKWTKDNYFTGILHYKGKFCSYYGKDNRAIVWSGNIGPPTYEGLIEWRAEKPIKKGESMVQINLYTDTENFNFDTLILNVE